MEVLMKGVVLFALAVLAVNCASITKRDVDGPLDEDADIRDNSTHLHASYTEFTDAENRSTNGRGTEASKLLTLLHDRFTRSTRAGNSGHTGPVRKNKAKKGNNCRRNRCQPLEPIMMQVEAVSLGMYDTVGYDANGIINGSWIVKLRTGNIEFNEEEKVIEIKEPGFYQVHSSLRYSDLETDHSMTHCIRITDKQGGEPKMKPCTMASATYSENPRLKYPWINNQVKSIQGYLYLEEGSTVGIRMSMGNDKAPRPNSIVFDPRECFFGLHKIAPPCKGRSRIFCKGA